ncbi:MAG: hypothetical protein K2G56_01610 [Eubacterium sp.]|nr:hypothetical protein [Eubacterium sp.]
MNLVNSIQRQALCKLIANQQKKHAKIKNPDIYKNHINEPEFWHNVAENYFIDKLINSGINYAPPYKLRSLGLISGGYLLQFEDEENKEKYVIRPNGEIEGPEEYTPDTGGCYVATAVYGSYDCPQVWTLRRYRDNQLAKTWYGRLFIHTYYAISPTIVKWFGNTKWFKDMWRGKLDKMVNDLQNSGVEDTPYNDIEW